MAELPLSYVGHLRTDRAGPSVADGLGFSLSAVFNAVRVLDSQVHRRSFNKTAIVNAE